MCLDQADITGIRDILGYIRANDTKSVLCSFGVDESVAQHCCFDHGAVLVFPDELADLREFLNAEGLSPGSAVPSVVVRDRLNRRYSQSRLEVAIVRADVLERREIEIFALVAGPAEIVAAERASRQENHFALRVAAPDVIVLSGLTSALVKAGLVPDGGGYNSHVDCTVLYFRGAAGRLELISDGHHPAALTEHLQQQPAYRLLRLLTGAWETQAIAVAAELQLADHLPMSIADLATQVGADRDSLQRLLRYLASLGVVRTVGQTYELTPLGQLLRTDAKYSLHPLALLYGGAFYSSFRQLGYSVRTGQDGFERLFGKHHFDYFADRPELGFNRAMAASASIFGHVAEVADFTSVSTVIDVAGGNGELLRQILHACPHLHGTLFERADVLEAAQANLADYLDRCTLLGGDFTQGVPTGGDVYLLSRVLHDWDDQQCQTILKRCAEAMPPGARLMIVERLLPEDNSPSLAMAWDVHMLCNVGGRERTASHYRELLSDAGFRLTARHDLPLDFVLLEASLPGAAAVQPGGHREGAHQQAH